jgi:nucleotide-binding universal stress UspA family protein
MASGAIRAPAANRAKRFAADLAADYVSRLILLPAVHDGTEEKRNIERAIAEHRPGLIVATCTHTRVRNVIAEDIIERLMQEAEVPLLVVGADALSEFRSRSDWRRVGASSPATFRRRMPSICFR